VLGTVEDELVVDELATVVGVDTEKLEREPLSDRDKGV
jgi:hypothetical protein